MSILLETSIISYCILNSIFIFYRLFTERELAKLKDHYEHEIKIHKNNYATVAREVELLDAINKQLIRKVNEK